MQTRNPCQSPIADKKSKPELKQTKTKVASEELPAGPESTAAADAQAEPSNSKTESWGEGWSWSEDSDRGRGWGYWYSGNTWGSCKDWDAWEKNDNWKSVTLRPSTCDLFDVPDTPPVKTPKPSPEKAKSAKDAEKDSGQKPEATTAEDEALDQKRKAAHAKYMRFYRSLEGQWYRCSLRLCQNIMQVACSGKKCKVGVKAKTSGAGLSFLNVKSQTSNSKHICAPVEVPRENLVFFSSLGAKRTRFGATRVST